MPDPGGRLATVDPVDDGIRYARQVDAGKIAAGKFVRLACQRFLNDLALAESGRGFWRFDRERAGAPIELAEGFPNIKGPFAGKPIILLPWQRWISSNLYGFVERSTGLRRFRQASIWVPRGNGKSTWLAPMALYSAFAEGEGGADAYAAAVTRDQAKIVWSTAWEMVRRSPGFRRHLGVATSVNSIFQDKSASKFVPISSDSKGLEGLNVHFGCLDEIASHRTARVYEVMLTALGKRLQPLLVSISTATNNTTGVGKQVWDYTVRVLTDVLDDERYFGVIYAADDEDDVWAEATMIKANPGWGVTVIPDQVRMIARQAKNNPAQETVYKTRHLNLWVTGNAPLFAMEHWKQCVDPSLDLADFEGRQCMIGLDIANKIDLTALVMLFWETGEDGETHYTVFCKSWLPSARKDTVPAYAAWIKAGRLIETPGETIDYNAIEEAILECCERFDVEAVTFDPWSATQLAQRMMGKNVPMLEYPMTVATMSEPTKGLDKKIREHRIHHDGDPVLAWCLSNVVGHYDAKENVFPRKELPGNKIDAAIATIMPLGHHMIGEDEFPTIYKEEDLLVF
jgi:phage terminase large subunit-like protein